jgi:hypothetical protein
MSAAFWRLSYPTTGVLRIRSSEAVATGTPIAATFSLLLSGLLEHTTDLPRLLRMCNVVDLLPRRNTMFGFGLWNVSLGGFSYCAR